MIEPVTPLSNLNKRRRSADSLRLRENKGFDEARPRNASPHIPSSIKSTSYGVVRALACRQGDFSPTYLHSCNKWAVNVAMSAIKTECHALVPYPPKYQDRCRVNQARVIYTASRVYFNQV